MLKAIDPLSLVETSIGPEELAIAVLSVFFVLADIPLAIGEIKHTLSMHFVLLPLPFVFPIVGPDVDASALDAIIIELAGVL